MPRQSSLRTCQSEVLSSGRKKEQKSTAHFSWFLSVICAGLGRSSAVPSTISCVARSPVLNPKPHVPSHGLPPRDLLPLSFPVRSHIVSVPSPAFSLLCSSKPLRESPACLLHLVLLLPKPCGKGSPKTTWLALHGCQCLGLNPGINLPLQPHFQLLPQSATPASTPVFFEPFWAAIVSMGRRGPVAWSEPSPSSPTGTVNQGELPPSYVMGRCHSHLPGSKLGHSYLTCT